MNMFTDMILIHRPGGHGRSTLADDLRPRLAEEQPAFCWQTCIRQIALIDESQLENVRPTLLRGDEIYHEDVGYRFLLEVICGLHSPLIGETEVYGQFKNSAAAFAYGDTLWSTRLKKFFHAPSPLPLISFQARGGRRCSEIYETETQEP